MIIKTLTNEIGLSEKVGNFEKNESNAPFKSFKIVFSESNDSFAEKLSFEKNVECCSLLSLNPSFKW